MSSISRLERHKQQTRLVFMRAAMELILEQGYEKVTVSAIADRAQYGRATFYLHFADKDELIWSLMQRHYDDEAQKVIDRIRSQASPLREYLGWLALFRDVAQNVAFYRQIQGAGVERLWDKTRIYLLEQTEHNLRAGNYATEHVLPIPFMARFIVGATLEIMRGWRENDYAETPEELVDMLFMMVYQQPPPALPAEFRPQLGDGASG